MEPKKQRSLLDRAEEAAALAEFAFARGATSVGIEAIALAAQLIRLHRLTEMKFPPLPLKKER